MARDGTQQCTKNRIKLPNNDNFWKAILRDVVMVFIPLFVIFKISTHPMVAKIGHQDPHKPKKRSQREMIEQSLYSLSLKRRQEELQKEHFFLDAMDESKCYDALTIDINAQLQPQKGRRPFKRNSPRKSLPHRQATIGKQSLGKLLSKLYFGKVSRRTTAPLGKL